jgi:hypothetical protein
LEEAALAESGRRGRIAAQPRIVRPIIVVGRIIAGVRSGRLRRIRLLL